MGDFKTKKFSDFKNNWSIKGNSENLNKASKIIASNIKSTPLLDWIESKGYKVEFETDVNKSCDFSYMGQDGNPYEFYLIETWTDEKLLKHLGHDWMGYENAEELVNLFGDEIRNGGEGSFEFSPEETDDDGNLIHDGDTKVIHKGSTRNRDGVRWSAYCPLGTDETRKLCEFGLFRAKTELLKMIGSTGTKNFDTLNKEMGYFDGRSLGDEGVIAKYMTYSNIHLRKNEDLDKATGTSYMLYKTSKLLSEISDNDRDFYVPMDILEEFVKLPLTNLAKS
jgi:hypothetical protein